MRIALTSVFVDDQSKALAFYTDVLGFVVKQNFSVGEFRWLTVVSAETDHPELLLEPNDNPAAATYQQAMFVQGLPLASFAVDDVTSEHARLTARGIRFTVPPTDVGTAVIAIFDDTCGNLIQLFQL
jgi:predicted enzyme related to lactoylglutathione lyase